MEKQEARFQHFVRAVYSPIQSWGQTIDPDQPGGLGPQGIAMTCQELSVSEMSATTQPGVELSAVGNTLVEGSAFTARAQRLTYTQAKEQLILDGENGVAQLQQKTRPDSGPIHLWARRSCTRSSRACLKWRVPSNSTSATSGRRICPRLGFAEDDRGRHDVSPAASPSCSDMPVACSVGRLAHARLECGPRGESDDELTTRGTAPLRHLLRKEKPLVGCGSDCRNAYRNLPSVADLEPEDLSGAPA